MAFYGIDYATIVNLILTLITIILHVIISNMICRFLLFILFNCNLSDEKVYIYKFNLENDLKDAFFNVQNYSSYYFILFILWSILFIYSETDIKELFIPIFISIATFCFSTQPDKSNLFAINDLHIGYGAALAYYKNYLAMTMTETFSERIDKFSTENMITMQKKLFILVPESCRVHNYLDSIEQENIERCRELPDGEISHAGIKNRKYNITIYNISGIRMAVEFAQPLKAFYLFKEKNLFTMNEMLYQRKLFSQTLKEFLKQDSFKYFKVVDYNDSEDRVEEVLTKNYHSL